MATKATAKKAVTKKEAPPSLGEVVVVYTKSSSHWMALLQPKIVTIEELKFLEGTQVTGKEGHRMERKRTLIPLDHVASLVAFASEDDLWSEPQPKIIRPLEEEKPSALLTSHEPPPQERPRHQHHGQNQNRNRNNRRNRGGSGKGQDARFQEMYESRRDKDFNR